MNTRIVLFGVCLAVAVSARAQESIRNVDGPGDFNKFLTPGTIDRWILQGEEGETIIARVASSEFDPVIELATNDGGEDKLLFSHDDEGSESWFSYRLPQAGEFKVRVHGYEFKGGGNYSLSLRRFKATRARVDEPLVGTFDRDGRSHHFLIGKQDQMLSASGRGIESWEVLDTKGRPVAQWSAGLRIENDGEYSVALVGQPGARYELQLHSAKRQAATIDQVIAGELAAGEMAVFDVAGQAGDFRLVEIERQGDLAARLIHAPLDEDQRPHIAAADAQPVLQYLGTADKGRFQRFAVLLGRNDRYQVQLAARGASSYSLSIKDPTTTLEVGENSAGALPVGATAFYRFPAAAGQLVIARLTSDKFDPQLRLYDEFGELVAENDDGDGELGSRLSYVVTKPQTFRLQVASLGNGGGGDYQLSLTEKKAKNLELGRDFQGTLQEGSTDYWSLEGKEGESIFFSVRSTNLDPFVSVRDPDGIVLGEDDNGGVDNDSLLAVKLPKSGRYTVWVSTLRGSGDYEIRSISGD